MTKLSRETAKDWSLKIEQQRAKYKAQIEILSRTTELVQFLKTQKRKLTLKKISQQEKLNQAWIRCLQTKVCGYRIIREFDPGSGLTLAACITHSSRTNKGLRSCVSGGRVSNA